LKANLFEMFSAWPIAPHPFEESYSSLTEQTYVIRTMSDARDAVSILLKVSTRLETCFLSTSSSSLSHIDRRSFPTYGSRPNERIREISDKPSKQR